MRSSLAVLRLMTSSNLVGSSTGKSEGAKSGASFRHGKVARADRLLKTSYGWRFPSTSIKQVFTAHFLQSI